jgi:hypothetical protein
MRSGSAAHGTHCVLSVLQAGVSSAERQSRSSLQLRLGRTHSLASLALSTMTWMIAGASPESIAMLQPKTREPSVLPPAPAVSLGLVSFRMLRAS